MCRFLQVLQPFRDLVWLRREGPPPGPAIANEVAFGERGGGERVFLRLGIAARGGVAGLQIPPRVQAVVKLGNGVAVMVVELG